MVSVLSGLYKINACSTVQFHKYAKLDRVSEGKGAGHCTQRVTGKIFIEGS
jgi:hypothetical protein